MQIMIVVSKIGVYILLTLLTVFILLTLHTLLTDLLPHLFKTTEQVVLRMMLSDRPVVDPKNDPKPERKKGTDLASCYRRAMAKNVL